MYLRSPLEYRYFSPSKDSGPSGTMASLTGRAIVNASRKVLALHHVLAGVTPR